MTAGQEFVKMLRPAGCVIFLLIFAAFFVMCFSHADPPIEGYSVPHDSDYFAEHLDELKAELCANVLPRLEGINDCEVTGDTLTITVDSEHFDECSNAVCYYYSDELFVFKKINLQKR